MKWTDEELIKAALSEGEIDSSNLDEIDRFIFEHKIYATKQRVEASIIYFTYVNWKIENKEDDILSEKGFFTKFKQRFHRQIGTGQRYYNVNRSSFKRDIHTKIAIRKLRHEALEWYEQRRKRNSQKETP